MARRQKTFSVIPELMSCLQGEDRESPSRDTKPPMTTKQAKKLYKEKNKGPKLSKAERRRQELMEQDRIRRELEKEKRLARAEAKREKKKEKEEKEKAEKRRKGLPLVDVHPSQDTLARFIRIEHPPEPSPEPEREPATHNDDSDQTISEGEGDERPRKRRRTSASPQVQRHEPRFQGDENEISLDPVDERNPKNVPDLEGFDVDHPSVQSSIDQQPLDESFSLDDELFDDLDFDAVMEEGLVVHSANTKAPPHSGTGQTEQKVRRGTPSLSSQRSGATCKSPRRSSLGECSANSSAEKEAHPATEQLLERTTSCHGAVLEPQMPADENMEMRQRTRKPTRRSPLQTISANKVQTLPIQKADLHDPSVAIPQPSRKPRTLSSGAKAFRSPTTPMGPPPLPPKFRSPHQIGSKVEQFRPRFLSKDNNDPNTTHTWVQRTVVINRINRVDSRGPFMVRQLLGDDFDDFFPSPSQEIRELSEEPDRGLQSCCESVKAAAPPVLRPATSPRISAFPMYQNWGSRDASTRDGQEKQASNTTEAQESTPVVDMPFLSTQDIFLSSQDFREFEKSFDSPIAAQKVPLEVSQSLTIHHEAHEITKSNVLHTTPTKLATGRSNSGGSSDMAEAASCSAGSQPTIPQSVGGVEVEDPPAVTTPQLANRSAAREKITPDKGQTLSHVEVPVIIAEAPKPSPKPFFTSSGTREQELLAIERSKMTAREDARARLATRATDKRSRQISPPVQDPFRPRQEAKTATTVPPTDISLQEAEDEALLLQVLEEEERLAKASETVSKQAEATAVQAAQAQAPRKANHAKAGSSPYEKMMSELAKLHTEKKDHNSIVASEDIEYEYAGWDDDLCEALCP